MPSDKSKSGMGRRRQGDTEPKRDDDSQRSREREIRREERQVGEHERGWDQGAFGDNPPSEEKPGTRRDLEEAEEEISRED